jgi:hypothetical protein
MRNEIATKLFKKNVSKLRGGFCGILTQSAIEFRSTRSKKGKTPLFRPTEPSYCHCRGRVTANSEVITSLLTSRRQ